MENCRIHSQRSLADFWDAPSPGRDGGRCWEMQEWDPAPVRENSRPARAVPAVPFPHSSESSEFLPRIPEPRGKALECWGGRGRSSIAPGAGNEEPGGGRSSARCSQGVKNPLRAAGMILDPTGIPGGVGSSESRDRPGWKRDRRSSRKYQIQHGNVAAGAAGAEL